MGETRTAYSKERKFCGNRHVSCKKVRENEEMSATRATTSSSDNANNAVSSTFGVN